MQSQCFPNESIESGVSAQTEQGIVDVEQAGVNRIRSMDRLSRRTFLKQIGIPMVCAGGLAFASGLLNFGCSRKKDERPNIILILTDDQGYGDIGYHGNQVIRTPNMDRLAAESTEFTHFYTATVCAPARASLITGRYNYRTGVIHTSRGGAKMHADEITLPEMLAGADYRTGIFGKWHLGDNYPMRAMDQGFQESLVHTSGGLCQTPDLPNDYFNPKLWHNGKPVQPEGYCTDIFTDALIRFIESSRGRSFFAYFSTNAPHTPLIIGEEYSRPYEASGCDSGLAKIYGMLTNLDDNIGRVLNALDRLNLEKRTIVIFMSDNGPDGIRYNSGLRGQKQSVYEGGIRVPFFIRWPGQIDAGRRIDRVAAHIDLFPTLLDICGIEIPQNLTIDGVSLLPLLGGSVNEWPDRFLFFQFHRGMTPRQYQNCAVRSQKYKLVSVHGMTQEPKSVLPLLEPRFELYDLENDPGEKENIAGVKMQIVEKMRRAYDAWFEDMRQTRGFKPGVIIIGSEHENPVHLCRYQDSHYVDGIPTGWPVRIVEGKYKVSINRCGYIGNGRIYVKINDYFESHALEHGTNMAIFNLPKATGFLDIWFEEKGKGRILFKKNNTIGDVELKRL
jgi:arylsulfatase A-like enzyme